MPKLNLLKTEADFAQFRLSKSFQSPLLRLRVRFARNQNFPRFGFIVPKKVLPHVVDRNKIKRRLKTSLMRAQAHIKPADFLFFPAKGLIKAPFIAVDEEIKQLIIKAGLWKS